MLIAYPVFTKLVLSGEVLVDNSIYAINLGADADRVLRRSGFRIGVGSEVTHPAH